MVRLIVKKITIPQLVKLRYIYKGLATAGDSIRLLDVNDDNVYAVTGRHWEGGIEDNGITYLDENNLEYACYDGCYEIVSYGTKKKEV